MRRCSVVALCLLVFPAAVGAQSPKTAVEWPAAGSWIAAQSPHCGEVVGRVVRRVSPFDDADTRLVPLVNAFVTASDSGPANLARQRNAGLVATTDTAGEFRIQLPPDRTAVFEVRAVGYEPALVALDGRRYRAAVVEIGLGSMGFHVQHRGVTVLASRGLTTCSP